MKRWWASPEDSIAALSVVDDSDVVNGAGVAFLGYHGLSQTALQPLAKETLVDTHRVRESLSKVDLEPIAKALGEATKPVMGDASERYGQLLAEEIHKRAVVATERLLNTWTTNGMPWPQAIEKAAEVHGVPLERLGRYATVMKTAGMTAHARADYADRELMAYASEFGNREAVTDNTLVIKQDKQMKFNEEEHPRNPNGEFKTKNATVSSITDKLDRITRINRINRINGINRKAAESQKASQKVTEDKPKVEQAKTEQKSLEQKDFGQKDYGQKQYGKKSYGVKDFGQRPPDGPKESNFKKVEDPFRWDKTVYIPMHAKTFENIRFAPNGEFFVGELDPDGVLAINEDEMEYWVKSQGNGKTIASGLEAMRKANVFLARSNFTPVDRNTMDGTYETGKKVHDNLNDDTATAKVVPRAKFKASPSGGAMISIGGNYDMVYQTYLIDLVNFDFEDFSKNLQSNELQEFNDEHPRGQDGRFTEKGRVTELDQKRMDRIDRINRMNKINSQDRAHQMKRLLEQQKEAQGKKDDSAQKVVSMDFGQKDYGKKKFGNKDFGKVDWEKIDNQNKPLPKPLDLKDKFVMFAGLDSIGSILDNDLPAFIPLKVGTVLGPNDVTSPRPFVNADLYDENEAPVNTVPAISMIIADADRYYVEHGRGSKQYITDEHSKRLTFKETEDDDDALAEIFANVPASLAENDRVWQPFIENVKNNYDQNTDRMAIGWESNDASDAVQMVLGNKDDFDALREDNATIEPIEGIECLADLLLKTTQGEGLTFTPEQVFGDLFNGGGRNNIGTNPPVSAYIIKIGQNS